jgi:hypothetical protein
VAGEGRQQEEGSQKSQDDEGGSVRLAKKHHRPRILEAGLKLTDVRKVHLRLPFPYISGQCLGESCMRENRTCSLGAGRKLARKRASSDPTIQKR